MSTATIPFLLPRETFPFYRNFAETDYDEITLSVIDSDAGLREAIRLFWATERVTFTPAGTVTVTSGTVGWDKVFRAPDMIGTPPILGSRLKGTVSALSSFNFSGSATTAQPALRARVDLVEAPIVESYQEYFDEPSVDSTVIQSGKLLFYVHYTGSVWKLRYKIDFYYEYFNNITPTESPVISIQNPAQMPSSDGSGTFLFMGYALNYNWSHYNDGTPSGVGISCATEEWSF
jgi:hypothetical protein